MPGAPTAQEIVRDAGWLLQALDPTGELVRLVEMNREAYRLASFLDDRMFQAPRNSQIGRWFEIVEAIPADARRDARWIFHIGHVGSTLVARLLGELEGVLSIREPRISESGVHRGFFGTGAVAPSAEPTLPSGAPLV